MIHKLLLLVWRGRKKFRLTWALLKDRRVPSWQKAIPFLPLLYILSPLNLLSFAIPIVGQIDDLILVLLAFELLERTVDKEILADYVQT
jgi:uncharacterized membrane protein YkvA (DUF1232 family)